MSQFEVFVSIKSDQYRNIWQQIIADNPKIDIRLIESVSFIAECLDLSKHNFILLCEESIIIAKDFACNINNLILELEAIMPNWGMVSPIGMLTDGKIVNYLKNLNGLNPTKSSYPKPALAVAGNIILINKRALISNNITFTEFSDLNDFAIKLSVKILQQNMLAIIDCRLIAYDQLEYNQKDILKLINKNLPINQQQYFSKSLIILHSYRKPSINIVCRTQLNRANLLTRMVESVAKSYLANSSLLDVKITILTDQDKLMLKGEVDRLNLVAPSLTIEAKWIQPSVKYHSRTHLVIKAVESSISDYIWFVDDDDYVSANALSIIGHNLSVTAKTLLIACSYGRFEQWRDDATAPYRSTIIRSYDSDNIFKLHQGENYIPICSCVFPAKLLQQQIADLKLIGDYYEDYALILLALGCTQSELIILNAYIANISIRKQGNSITQQDRTYWHYSYINFVSELTKSKNSGSTVMWQIANQTKCKSPILSLIRNPRKLRYRINQLFYNILTFGFKDTINKISRFFNKR